MQFLDEEIFFVGATRDAKSQYRWESDGEEINLEIIRQVYTTALVHFLDAYHPLNCLVAIRQDGWVSISAREFEYKARAVCQVEQGMDLPFLSISNMTL